MPPIHFKPDSHFSITNRIDWNINQKVKEKGERERERERESLSQSKRVPTHLQLSPAHFPPIYSLLYIPFAFTVSHSNSILSHTKNTSNNVITNPFLCPNFLPHFPHYHSHLCLHNTQNTNLKHKPKPTPNTIHKPKTPTKSLHIFKKIWRVFKPCPPPLPHGPCPLLLPNQHLPRMVWQLA